VKTDQGTQAGVYITVHVDSSLGWWGGFISYLGGDEENSSRTKLR